MIQDYHRNTHLEGADNRGTSHVIQETRKPVTSTFQETPVYQQYQHSNPPVQSGTYQHSQPTQSYTYQQAPNTSTTYHNQPEVNRYTETHLYTANQHPAPRSYQASPSPDRPRYEYRESYGAGTGSPTRESVKLVESNADFKVYQYRSVKKETVHIDDGNRRVVTGDRYSDGTPVKRSTHRQQGSPEIPFNPRRSTVYSNSKYITVVRNGREVQEEILDYN